MDNRVPQEGTVLVGRNLIANMRAASPGTLGASLTAVCAHEAGHILQSRYADIDQQLVARPRFGLDIELHADFICGYVAARRRNGRSEYPAIRHAMTQFAMGDKGRVIFPHGTPQQRGDAVYAGFLLADRSGLSPRDVAAEGISFLDASAGR